MAARVHRMDLRFEGENRAMIQIENLSKRYGKNEILRQITVRFESGGIYGLVGANGCGKTTPMRCICGFSQPTTGYVLVNGCLVGDGVRSGGNRRCKGRRGQQGGGFCPRRRA